jgi:epoxyqueuosine reductase
MTEHLAETVPPANHAIYRQLREKIGPWASELGFQQVGVTDIDLGEHEQRLQTWLDRGFQGEMAYMGHHGRKRSQPAELVPGTTRILSLRMDYMPEGDQPLAQLASTAANRGAAYVARYALGRDYHKVIRQRLVKLWQQMAEELASHGIDQHSARVFTDSAPVLEKALAEKAGLGWIGKNTLLLNHRAGSLFFLAEIFTDVPLPIDPPQATNHCGSCTSCIDVCPTAAIVGPYQLDARRCISYLTIEHRGSIPVELRAAMGNRIFGCDDCQLFCPWNKFAQVSSVADFDPRHGLDSSALLTLYAWTEDEFLARTAGSAIRRTGYTGWRRNLAVALGNCDYDDGIYQALATSLDDAPELVQEHIRWALKTLDGRRSRIATSP